MACCVVRPWEEMLAGDCACVGRGLCVSDSVICIVCAGFVSLLLRLLDRIVPLGGIRMRVC